MIHTILGDSNWLTNGELFTCILRTPSPNQAQYTNDDSRPTSMLLFKGLFTKVGQGFSRLEQVCSKNPCLLLASELSFSSTDSSDIEKLISTHSGNLIFIGGFGFSTGKSLRVMAQQPNILASWDEGFIVDDAKYNCGWVWIKVENKLKCHIFIKTYIDQSHEPPLEIVEGKKVIRFQAKDIAIFPILCSELICQRENNPKDLIKESLVSNPFNGRVLVTLSSYADNPSNANWQTGISRFVSISSELRLLINNSAQPTPLADETADKWRSLSGAYQKFGFMKEPEIPLTHVKYVKEAQFEGLVLRKSEVGITAGKIGWTNSPVEGKYLLTLNYKDIWKDGTLTPIKETANSIEVIRTIDRFSNTAIEKCGCQNKPLGTSVISNIAEFKSEYSSKAENERDQLAKELVNRCLYGIDRSERSLNFDKLSKEEAGSFCKAFLSILQIMNVGDFPLNVSETTYGQILSKELSQEILVWDSPSIRSSDMVKKLEGLAIESGSGPALCVIGNGNGYGDLPNSRVVSKRTTDISASKQSGGERQITDTRDRVIYWQKMGELEEIYAKEGEVVMLRNEIKTILGKIREHAAA